jgi:hypothetical protein
VTIDAGLRAWTARRTGADARENGEDAPVREAVVPAGAGRADGD